MARRSLSFPTLPPQAIAHGATSPDPGALYSYCFSSIENDMVVWNGSSWRTAGKGLAAKLYALAFGSSNYYQSAQATGGETGVATGFGVAGLIQVGADASGTAVISAKDTTAPGGWLMYLSASRFVFTICNAAATKAFVDAPRRIITAADIGRVFLFVGILDAAGTVHAWVDRDEYLGGTANLNGYTPSTAAARIGLSYNLLNAPTSTRVIDVGTFRGVPTAAQIRDFYDQTRASGMLPVAIGGAAITHLTSLPRALAGTTIAAGQLAPAALNDTATLAAADIMSRVGSPTIAEIDIGAIDGRKSYGVLGATTDSYLETTSFGFRGSASGFTFDGVFTVGAQTGAEQFIVGGYDAAGGAGFTFYTTPTGGGTWRLYAVGAGDMVVGIAAAGKPTRVTVTWDGSTWRGYLDGVETMTPVTAGWTARNTTGNKLRIGRSSSTGAGNPATMCTVHKLVGCDVVTTSTEIAAMQRTLETTGRLTLPAGKTNAHEWDLTLDIAPAPDAGVPAQILDRVGTDHLTRVGQMTVNGTGLRDFTNQYPISVSAARGLPGVATGWWVEVVVRAVQGAGPNQVYFSNTGASANGLNLYVIPNTLILRANTSDGVTPVNLDYAFPSSADYHVVFEYTGTLARLWVNGVLRVTSIAFGYVPGSLPTKLGTLYNGGVSWSSDVSTLYGAAGGNSTITSAEIAAASTYALANLKPGGIFGKTLRRWSIPDDVADAGGRVPSLIRERTTGADHLFMMGSPLQVSRRTERAWSYETTPVISGFTPASNATYYESSATGHDGGATDGKSVALLVRIDAQTVNKFREVVSLGTAAQQRFSIRMAGANAFLQINWWNGGAFVSTSAITVAAADVGKLLLVVTMWDPVAGKARVFSKRAEIGSGASMGAYVPGTGASLRLGMHHNATTYSTYFSEELTIFGVQTFDGVWTIPEIHALYDATAALEDMVAVPNKTGHLYSLKQSIGTSNALPAEVPDLAGASPLARIGAPTLKHHYAHAVGW